ncbi:MAG: hypothetical protein KC466_18900, partial [Myxococcales bacterium]|nr:hypothetical protein [Myxococcales bacterium]
MTNWTPIRSGRTIELRQGWRAGSGARRRGSPWAKLLVGFMAVALVFTAALTRNPKMEAGATEPPAIMQSVASDDMVASVAPTSLSIPVDLPDDVDLEFDEDAIGSPSGPDVVGGAPGPEVDLVEEVPAEPSPFRKITYNVGRQDTLYDVLTSYGVSSREVHEVARAARGIFNFAYMRPGDELKFELLRDPIELSSLTYPVRRDAHLYIVRDGDRFVAREEALETDKRLTAVSGRIETSLYDAGVRAGLDMNVIARLADIFSWEIDFVRDIRAGDSFMVLFEQRYREDAYLGPGDILAASFTNNGRTLEAFAYPDENGEMSYYTAEGRSLRKEFLRAPLEYTRISSYFSQARFHPVLKRTVPHLGVDFAAP